MRDTGLRADKEDRDRCDAREVRGVARESAKGVRRAIFVAIFVLITSCNEGNVFTCRLTRSPAAWSRFKGQLCRPKGDLDSQWNSRALIPYLILAGKRKERQ